MKDIILTALPSADVTFKGKDVYVKSDDREKSMKDLELFFKSKSVTYQFKESYKSSIGVLNVPLLGGDIIFKPIRAKGQGGRDFEEQVFNDINNYFAGVELKELVHSDVIELLASTLKLKPRLSGKVIHVGKQQNKRTLEYSLSGSGLEVKNNTGSTVADIIVTQNKNTYYLSLKHGKTYYSLNGGVGKFFLDIKTKKSINEYFGFDGVKMGGFGEEFSVATKKPNYAFVKANLEDIIGQSIGFNLVIVHKKTKGDVLVKNVSSLSKVSISGLNESSYVYPVPNKRKYANIRVQANINGIRYRADLQFRGTQASDRGPKYLRILLERL